MEEKMDGMENAREKAMRLKRRRRTGQRGETRMSAVLYTIINMEDAEGKKLVMNAYEVRELTLEEWENA